MGFETVSSNEPEKKGIKKIIKGAALGVSLGLAMHAVDAGAENKKVERTDPEKSTTIRMTAEDLKKNINKGREQIEGITKLKMGFSFENKSNTVIDVHSSAQSATEDIVKGEKSIVLGDNIIPIEDSYIGIWKEKEGNLIIHVTHFPKGHKIGLGGSNLWLTRDTYTFDGDKLINTEHEKSVDEKGYSRDR